MLGRISLPAGVVGHEIAHVSRVMGCDIGVLRVDQSVMVRTIGIVMASCAQGLGRVTDVAKLVDVEAMLAGR